VNKQLNEKKEQLKISLIKMNKVVIAFSGGVDSAFLLAFSHQILGKNTIAVTIDSPFTPSWELDDAKEFTKSMKINHKIIKIVYKELEYIRKNQLDRCYYCKKLIFKRIKDFAKKNNFKFVLDASNYDDLNDYRPGMKALKELKIISPLIDVGLKKEEVRILSKKMNLTSWDKPSMACLASRFPYNSPITSSGLEKIEKSEEYIRSFGIKQLRVRYFDEIAKIEVFKKDLKLIIKNSQRIAKFMKKLGFKYITIDLEGYRTGSLNEAL